MKIGIDLNDVVRAHTAQFASYYKKNVDRTFDIEDVDVWTNDLMQVFPFDTKQEYLEFLYNDFAFEIHASAQLMGKNLGSRMIDWTKELEDYDEIPELCLISTGEYDKTIGATYFFLSKLATKIREVHLLLKEDNIWDYCDVLVTANPNALVLKPDNKISIKIDTSYNLEASADYTYDTFIDFMNDKEIIEKITNKTN